MPCKIVKMMFATVRARPLCQTKLRARRMLAGKNSAIIIEVIGSSEIGQRSQILRCVLLDRKREGCFENSIRITLLEKRVTVEAQPSMPFESLAGSPDAAVKLEDKTTSFGEMIQHESA